MAGCLLLALVGIQVGGALELRSRDGEVEMKIPSPVSNKYLGPQSFRINASAQNIEIVEAPSFADRGLDFAEYKNKVVFLKLPWFFCLDMTLSEFYTRADDHGLVAVVFEDINEPAGKSWNRYSGWGSKRRKHGSTAMLVTAPTDPWVPSVLSDLDSNSCSKVDLILTADPNVNVKAWRNGGFIFLFRVLNPVFAMHTAWLAVRYLWREYHAPKKWIWRLGHLIMIVEIPAMALVAASLATGMWTDDWAPVWNVCSFFSGLPFSSWCTTIFMGLFWRRVTTMVDNADLLANTPAITSSADEAKWMDVVVLIAMVIGDVFYAIVCCSHKAPVYKSTCSHKFFIHRRGGLLLAIGQVVSLIWLTSIAFPILQRLHKFRREGLATATQAMERLALWVGLSVAFMIMSLILLIMGGTMRVLGSSAMGLFMAIFFWTRIGTSWAQVSAVCGRRTPTCCTQAQIEVDAPPNSGGLLNSTGDSSAVQAIILHSTATLQVGYHVRIVEVEMNGRVGTNLDVADRSSLPDFIAMPMVVVENNESGHAEYSIVPLREASATCLNLWTKQAEGSHAFVRLPNEPFLRVTTLSFDFGSAGGHAMLANNAPVIAAGEVETTGRGEVLRWTNMSGTYQPVRRSVGQSGLPLRKLWLWTSSAEVDAMQESKRSSLLDQGLLVPNTNQASTYSWFLHASGAGDEKWNNVGAHEEGEKFVFTPPSDGGEGNDAAALMERVIKEVNQSAVNKMEAEAEAQQRHLFRKELGFAKNWKFGSNASEYQSERDVLGDTDRPRGVLIVEGSRTLRSMRPR